MDVAGNGGSALLACAMDGFLNGLKELLRKGSDVNQRQKTTENTPLHISAMNGHNECALLLLENGADPKLVNRQGMTPHQLAIHVGQNSIASTILHFQPNLTPAHQSCNISSSPSSRSLGSTSLPRTMAPPPALLIPPNSLQPTPSSNPKNTSLPPISEVIVPTNLPPKNLASPENSIILILTFLYL